MREIIILMLVVGLLNGCATGDALTTNYGTKELTQENVGKIIKGKTTQNEVLEIFGEPMSKTQSGIINMWIYSRSITKSIDNNIWAPEIKAMSYGLTVMFDEKGIVKDYSYSEVNPMQKVEVTHN